MIYDCPVCKQSAVKYEDGSPRPITIEDKYYYHYVSICDNCNNVFCYKIELMKER